MKTKKMYLGVFVIILTFYTVKLSATATPLTSDNEI